MLFVIRRSQLRPWSNPVHAGNPRLFGAKVGGLFYFFTQYQTFRAAISHSTPTNATKRHSFCCVRRGFLFGSFRGCPAQRNKISVIVAFVFLTLSSLPEMVPNKHITCRPRVSTHFPPGLGPSSPEFGFQLLVRHSVDHGYMNIVMVQCPSHPVNIAVFLHQLTGVYLASGVRRYVLRKP